jgi:P27 family predicted phage terminase small subunit
MGKNGTFPWSSEESTENEGGIAKLQKPPKDLPLEAKKLWLRIREEYGINDATGETYLATGCRLFARMREAQKILKREGLTVKGRYGQPLPHPLVKVELDASAAMIRAFKSLNLDVEPLQNGPGRPGGKC